MSETTGPLTDDDIWQCWIEPRPLCDECDRDALCKHDVADFARALLALAWERVIADIDPHETGTGIDTGRIHRNSARAGAVASIRRILGVKHE